MFVCPKRRNFVSSKESFAARSLFFSVASVLKLDRQNSDTVQRTTTRLASSFFQLPNYEITQLPNP